MDNATLQALMSALRSILIDAGATLVARGYLTNENANSIVGALLVIGPLIWGVAQKFMAERAAKKRETVAVNVGVVVADNTVGKTPSIAPASVPLLLETIGPRIQVNEKSPDIQPVVRPDPNVPYSSSRPTNTTHL